MAVGLIPNPNKQESMAMAVQLLTQLEEAGEEVWVEGAAAARLERENHPFPSWEDNVRFAIVLGGDGTLLAAGRRLLGQNVPLVGVNLGRLGFLTELEVDELPRFLPKLLSGNYKVKQRSALAAAVIREGKQVVQKFAINDIVIARGAFARIINLETKINGEYVATYPADGTHHLYFHRLHSLLFVCRRAPCGSVFGGACDHPICAHTLYARSIVIKATDVVEITVRANRETTMLSIDGQEGFALANDDLVQVSRAEATLPLIELGSRSFYHRLRTRLSEGRL